MFLRNPLSLFRKLTIATAALAMAGLFAALPASAQPAAPEKNQQQLRVYLPVMTSNPSALAAGFRVESGDDWQPYVLRSGDDMALLALDLGRDVSLMTCITRSAAQPLAELRPGQVVYIPAAHFRCHTAAEGETVSEIADLYGVTVDDLLDTWWNHLDDAEQPLAEGRRVLVPHATAVDLTERREAAEAPVQPSQPVDWPYGDGKMIWPLDGVISQGFHSGHKALDIAVPLGTSVRAVDNGVVVKAGYSTVGYGGRIVIDHQIDYLTLYAHLSRSMVQEGDVVQKGQIIGYVGSTGNSTGPHLHFELRDFGYLVDPRALLHEE